ncbi:MAG TPA: hypothetical protein VD927_14260 [Chryseosolibacter sp.]|nr:hypothetical protein [Chryseosolibacter sp.]
MHKLKSPVLWILILTCFFFSTDQRKLVKTKVSKDITVSLPPDWKAMDQLDFTERYPSVRAPIAAYTNIHRSVDFAVNISATQWPDANLELAQRFFKSSIMNMFDRAEFENEGVKEVNGKKYVYFTFISRVQGNRSNESLRDPVVRYNHLQYLVEKDRTLVFSFSSPFRERDEWLETADQIMNSIRIK